METSFSLLLDIVVSLLLVATIIFAVRLNKRLGSLRRERKELEDFASSFNAALTRAEDSISSLKATTDGLEEQVNKAHALRDDLVFLTERGTASADRLEEVIRDSRQTSQKEPAAISPVSSPALSRAKFGLGASVDAAPDDEKELKSDAERELLRALQSAR